MDSTVYLGAILISLVLVLPAQSQPNATTHKSSAHAHGPPKPTRSPVDELDKQIRSYLINQRLEIEFGLGPPFLKPIVIKEIERGRRYDLKNDKRFYDNLFKDMMNKKVLGHDPSGFRKDIKAKLMNGTLSDAKVGEIFNDMLVGMRKTFGEEIDYEIDQILSKILPKTTPPPPPRVETNSSDLNKQINSYLIDLRLEIEFGSGPPYLEKFVAKEIKKGRGQDLKQDKYFYDNLFEEMLRKKVLGHDRKGFRKEIRTRFHNGTLSEARAEKIFNLMADILKKTFDEEIDYEIDNMLRLQTKRTNMKNETYNHNEKINKETFNHNKTIKKETYNHNEKERKKPTNKMKQ